MWEDCKWLFMRGEPNGINDSGITSQKSTGFDGLAREIIQNSLDAHNDDVDLPVEVVFKKKRLPINLYPNLNDLLENVNRCRDFIKNKPKDKGHRFYENFEKVISESINEGFFDVLEISDYNTSGLSDIHDQIQGNWASLVRVSGSSNKDEDDGGSFGYGKYAPFVFSSTRTVIYSTKNKEGNIGVMGKTILSGHLNNGKRSPIGYFGNLYQYKIDDYTEEDAYPFTNANNFPSEYLRTKIGTSIFVLNVNFGSSWFKETVLSVLQYFFKTIIDNKLVVKIEDDTENLSTITISNETISQICKLEAFYDEDKTEKIVEHITMLDNPDTITYVSEPIDLSFFGYEESGLLELKILSRDDLKIKSMYFTRKNGMVIVEQPFNNLLPYVGIMTTANDTMNRFLRECEGPKHDEWNGNNFRELEADKNKANSVIRKIKKWVKDCLVKSCGVVPKEKINAFGMESFLPLDLEGEKDGGTSEVINFVPIETKLHLSKSKTLQSTTSKSNDYVNTEDGGETVEGPNGINTTTGENVTKPMNGDNQDTVNIGESENGNISVKKRVSISSVKAPLVSGNNTYRVTFIPNEDVNNCDLQIRRAGVDMSEEIKVSNKKLILNDGKIDCDKFDLRKGEKISIEIMLDTPFRGALEVGCYVKE